MTTFHFTLSKAEPHLTNLSGEELSYKTAIKGDYARADIKARGFWRRGVYAYFDVSFANVNAETYKDLDMQHPFLRREKRVRKGSMGIVLGLSMPLSQHLYLVPMVV